MARVARRGGDRDVLHVLRCGVLGVHRWLELGPIRLHASAAFGPLVLVGLTGSDDRPSLEGLFAALIGKSSSTCCKPDGAQSMALAQRRAAAAREAGVAART
ncbi:MAG: hypothetical protein U0235_29580 [Polyangiaceae bacterium]